MMKIDRKAVLKRINDKYVPHGCYATFNGKGGVDVVCDVLGPVRRHASLADLAQELSVLSPGEEVRSALPEAVRR